MTTNPKQGKNSPPAGENSSPVRGRHRRMKLVELERYIEGRQEWRRGTMVHGGCVYDIELLQFLLRTEIRTKGRAAELLRRLRTELAATGKAADRAWKEQVENVLLVLALSGVSADGSSGELIPTPGRELIPPEPTGLIPPEPTDEAHEMAHEPMSPSPGRGR